MPELGSSRIGAFRRVILSVAASLWAILPVVMLFAVIAGRLAEGHTAGAVK